MDNQAEWILIERCRAGSTAAFEPLVRHYEGRGLALAEALLGDRDEAADAVQDAFVRAYRTLHRLEDGSRFGPWFRTILRNRCLDALRAARRRGRTSLDDMPPGPATRVDPVALQSLEREERAAVVRSALASVSAAHREVLVLKELEGMSYAEIAGITGTAAGTVASRLHHARLALARALSAALTAEEAAP